MTSGRETSLSGAPHASPVGEPPTGTGVEIMKVLLIIPPYQTITSNVGVGHQVPLGLLMVGGPLLDAGHDVRLLDAECRRMSLEAIVREVRRDRPDVVMTGHA